MMGDQLYGRILQLAKRLEQNGGCLQGRRTGDETQDNFLRKTRLFNAALSKFSPADRKIWGDLVNDGNDDLIAPWRRQAYAQRAETRKKRLQLSLPSGVKQRPFEQAGARGLRHEAIIQIIQRLHAENIKPTVKLVCRRLKMDFPDLTEVKLDTVRKDLRKLKVARQSG